MFGLLRTFIVLSIAVISSFAVRGLNQPQETFIPPGLPDPSARLLAVITRDTQLLSGPGGRVLEATLKMCQTVFILEMSDDGRYGRVHGFGNSHTWVALEDAKGVLPNYGQRGGQPVLGICRKK